MALRFAFDLGTASLGWAVFKLRVDTDRDGKPVYSPEMLVATGVRIFDDGRNPQTGESRAQGRRLPRAMRRSRDRFVQRRDFVMAKLVEIRLMPADRAAQKTLEQLDPNRLRADALKSALPLHHVGRALFHLNQRRGFKSNRKTDDPGDGGKIASAAARLAEKMQGFETLGAFFAARQADADVRKRLPTRIRPDNANKDELYEFYPTRDMLEHEFDLICRRQAAFNADFPGAAEIDQLRHAIFHQRPLRDVHPGYCSFYPKEPRLARAHPLAEDWIFYQKINQLRAEDDDGYPVPMSLAQRDDMVDRLRRGENLTWDRVRKALHMPGKSGRINLEEGGEKQIEGSALVKRFKGTKARPGPFFAQWDGLTEDGVLAIIAAYRNSDTDAQLLASLESFALDAARQELALGCSLPDGYIAVSERAAREIVAELKREIVPYSEAARRAGLHHSDKRDGEVFDRLPYYNEIAELKRHLGHGTGDPNDPRDLRFGRIANPTVHIGLNQLRRVVNALSDRFGRPDQIVLELSRELKQSRQQKLDAGRMRDANRKVNDQRREELKSYGFYQEGDRRRTQEGLMRMRLWEELGPPSNRFCPYSGRPITSLATLLSDEVEIEHILPLSRTLDDSMANKTVAFRQWNRLKRNLTPADAAKRYPEMFDQDEMIVRTRSMPGNKRWRFHPDAMERFAGDKSFEARQLAETQHFGVVARHYLSKLSPANPDQGEMQVWVTTGRLTADLRRKWGLHLGTNQKNRDDHRHHAVDACVIGVIDRGLVNRLAGAAARDEENQALSRILADIDEPYEGYSDEVNKAVRQVVVSHRANHRIGGKLHEDGAYGPVRDNEENAARGELSAANAVIRRDVTSLTAKQIGQVRDLAIRNRLEAVLAEGRRIYPDKSDFDRHLPELLAEWSRKTGTRRVRALVRDESVVPLGRRSDGSRYKYVVPGENHHMDIVETPDGIWRGVAQSVFDANQKAPQTDWRGIYPNARFIMRLHKNDTIQLFDEDGVNRIKRVVRIAPSANRLMLAEHMQAGKLQERHDDKEDAFRWDLATIGKLKARRARQVRVDETGRVRVVPYGP